MRPHHQHQNNKGDSDSAASQTREAHTSSSFVCDPSWAARSPCATHADHPQLQAPSHVPTGSLELQGVVARSGTGQPQARNLATGNHLRRQHLGKRGADVERAFRGGGVRNHATRGGEEDTENGRQGTQEGATGTRSTREKRPREGNQEEAARRQQPEVAGRRGSGNNGDAGVTGVAGRQAGKGSSPQSCRRWAWASTDAPALHSPSGSTAPFATPANSTQPPSQRKKSDSRDQAWRKLPIERRNQKPPQPPAKHRGASQKRHPRKQTAGRGHTFLLQELLLRLEVTQPGMPDLEAAHKHSASESRKRRGVEQTPSQVEHRGNARRTCRAHTHHTLPAAHLNTKKRSAEPDRGYCSEHGVSTRENGRRRSTCRTTSGLPYRSRTSPAPSPRSHPRVSVAHQLGLRRPKVTTRETAVKASDERGMREGALASDTKPVSSHK